METSIVNVISSGSKGNCEIYLKNIAVDMGIPYSKIKPFVNNLQIVIYSHVHGDHFNKSTLKTLAFERPSLRFAIGEHMINDFQGIKNVDVCKIGQMYDYGSFMISCVQLYHDCPNVGWRIFVKKPNGEYYKIFRATDTAHLEGIEAKNYDLYAIEFNYNEETVNEQIAAAKARGEFCYRIGAINSHLSEQQARDFIYKNAGPNSKVLMLHESKTV